MKAVLLDTDVLLDYLEARLPFGYDMLRIVGDIMKGKIQGFTTAVIVANCHYILRKKVSSRVARENLASLLHYLEVIPIYSAQVVDALQSDFADFEDALQHEAAVHSGKIEAILTRNIKDYKKARIPVLTPAAFLALNAS